MRERALQTRIFQLITENELKDKITTTKLEEGSSINKKYIENIERFLSSMSGDCEIITPEIKKEDPSKIKESSISFDKKFRLRPDILLKDDHDRYHIFEIKTSKKSARETITEVTAYYYEIKKHFPALCKHDILLSIVLTEESPLVHKSITWLVQEGFSVVALIAEENNHDISFKFLPLDNYENENEVDIQRVVLYQSGFPMDQIGNIGVDKLSTYFEWTMSSYSALIGLSAINIITIYQHDTFQINSILPNPYNKTTTNIFLERNSQLTKKTIKEDSTLWHWDDLNDDLQDDVDSNEIFITEGHYTRKLNDSFEYSFTTGAMNLHKKFYDNLQNKGANISWDQSTNNLDNLQREISAGIKTVHCLSFCGEFGAKEAESTFELLNQENVNLTNVTLSILKRMIQ